MQLAKSLKAHFLQFLFVFIAFLTMILVSYFYVNSLARNQMVDYSEEVMQSTEANIQFILSDSEYSLGSITFVIENMIDEGASEKLILEEMKEWSVWLNNRESGFHNSLGVYGVINDTYLDGMGWVPPDDYEVKSRPWYTEAMESSKEFNYTDPYIDELTKEKIVSISRLIKDKDGNKLGVIAIDIDISNIVDYIEGLNIENGGYGILLDNKLKIVTTEDKTLIGYSLNQESEKISSSLAGIGKKLEAEKTISADEFTDYQGVKKIVYFKEIFNNWHLGIIAPVNRYYKEVYTLGMVLSVIGLILAIALCYILYMLSVAKLRSDEENKFKSNFLAKMSHEIRTPMNAIIGMAELILHKEIPADIHENALSIKQASSNLLSIINDILDFSKIESGKISLMYEKYRFSSLINDVVNIIRTRTAGKPILFITNIDSTIPDSLIGDEARFRQVLINLLINSVKYTKEGFISMNITGDLIENEKKVIIKIAIEDSGIGIKEEDIDKLFGNFVKLDIQKNKGIEGTGLGLAIVKGLCCAVGGDVSVESTYGEGSIFTVTIPQQYEVYEKCAEVISPETKSVLVYETRTRYAKSITETITNLGVTCSLVEKQSDFYDELERKSYNYAFVASFTFENVKRMIERIGNKTKVIILSEYGELISIKNVRSIVMPIHAISVANILNDIPEDQSYQKDEKADIQFIAPNARILLVDDIETNLKVAEGLMAPYQMKIDSCKSGIAAIELIKKNQYDIIFMDHMMPDMDGIETTDKIRKFEEVSGYHKKVIIIALTANAIYGMKEMFLKNGFDDFLAKPIEMSKLNDKLEQWIPLEKRQEPREREINVEIPDFTISGIDTRAGVIMTGGTIDNYVNTLAIYYQDVVNKRKELEECIDQENSSLFSTYIHALKSASASIGAIELSELARDLENASKKGDMDYIKTYINEFFHSLEIVVENIEPIIKNKITKGQSISNVDDVSLKNLYKDLKEAISDMNIRIVDEIIKELFKEEWDEETKKTIENISNCILLFEYEEAIEIIEKNL